VYVGAAGTLFVFDAAGTDGCSGIPKSCEPLWSADTNDDIFSSPAVANGVVYIGSNDHHVDAFDAAGTIDCAGVPKQCSPIWSFDTGAFISSSPAVVNGMVYIGSLDHNLYAFGL
jgi:outer membrane protein assembly factor BamB